MVSESWDEIEIVDSSIETLNYSDLAKIHGFSEYSLFISFLYFHLEKLQRKLIDSSQDKFVSHISRKNRHITNLSIIQYAHPFWPQNTRLCG